MGHKQTMNEERRTMDVNVNVSFLAVCKCGKASVACSTVLGRLGFSCLTRGGRRKAEAHPKREIGTDQQNAKCGTHKPNSKIETDRIKLLLQLYGILLLICNM